MKTRLSAKTLPFLLILFAIRATATVVNINSDHSNYTFLSGTTYYVSANVTLSGTTTFQGGAILKYDGSGQINIDSGGTMVCPSGTDRAIFTSYNDDTVGETVLGSSGTPAAEDVNIFLAASGGTLSNLRFSYGSNVFPPFSSGPSLQNCEFFYDDFMYVEAPVIDNCLFVGSPLDWLVCAGANTVQNNTFVDSSSMLDDAEGGPTSVVVASDNLFDSSDVQDWTYAGATGGNNAFYNCGDYLGSYYSGLPGDIGLSSAPGYQSGQLGNYYLPSGSPLIDAGDMSASDAGLGAFTTQTIQTPDSGTVDIGYHYPVAPPNNSLGTNFWLTFLNSYNVWNNEPPPVALSLLISSAQGASGAVTMTANGPTLTLSGCDDTDVNGTYVLTNMPSAMLSLFESAFSYNPGRVYLKDTNFVCLDNSGYDQGQAWDMMVYNPSAPFAYKGFDFRYNSTTSTPQLSEVAWTDYNASDTPPTSTVCTWSPIILPFTLAAEGATNLVLPAEAMVWEYDQVEDRGVCVTSTAPVAVYGMNFTKWGSTAFTAYPTAFLGTNYCLLSRHVLYGNEYSQFGIVATKNNTTVTITPSLTASLQGSLWTSSITLQAGQVYQINSSGGAYPNYPDVTGTRISSDKPIAVLAGNNLIEVPDNITQAGNSLQPEQLPVEDWGTEALSLSFAGRSNGDTYRVLAAYNNTIVTIAGTVVTITGFRDPDLGPWDVTTTNETVVTNLDAGQWYDVMIDGPAVFQANQPIQVAKFANGEQFDHSFSFTPPYEGDPCEILLPPVGQWLSTNIVVTLTNDLPNQVLGDFDENFLNLIVSPTATSSTFVDGSLVNVTNYVPMGDSGYYGAQITITNSGTHTVTSSQPVGVEVYGWGPWDAYSYFGGIAR